MWSRHLATSTCVGRTNCWQQSRFLQNKYALGKHIWRKACSSKPPILTVVPTRCLSNITWCSVSKVTLYIAYSVQRLATGWTVLGSNSGRCEIFCISPDRPWVPPSLLYSWYRVSFPGVKRSERDADHPPLSSAKDKEREEVYLYSTLDLRGLLQGEIYFRFAFIYVCVCVCIYIHRVTQKTGNLKNPTKIEEIQEKNLLIETEPLQLAF